MKGEVVGRKKGYGKLDVQYSTVDITFAQYEKYNNKTASNF